MGYSAQISHSMLQVEGQTQSCHLLLATHGSGAEICVGAFSTEMTGGTVLVSCLLI